MTNARLELIRFGGDRPKPGLSQDLAALHSALLDHSPLVLMGPDFMRSFYYSLLPADGAIFGAVAYVDQVPAGFIVATAEAESFMMGSVRRHWLRLCWTMAMSVLKRPSRLLAMKEAYAIQANVQAQQVGADTGELLSFGVLPDYRSRRFIKTTGIHVASELFDVALEQMAATGAKHIRAIVDKDNLEAQLFYRSKGWRIGLKSVAGWSVPTMEFVRDLESQKDC